MRTSYPKSRLSDVQTLLADYFNLAINQFFLSPDEAYKRLLASQYSKLIENGNTSVIYGKTGYELFYDVFGMISENIRPFYSTGDLPTTKEYWAGWILAYLQWSTARSFDSIHEYLPFDTIIQMYHPYHEMDERKFVDDVLMKYFLKETNLKRIRRRNKLTQSELAKRAEVSIRTIQMLEQRQNDINQSKAINLFNIAKALHCSIEDLLE